MMTIKRICLLTSLFFTTLISTAQNITAFTDANNRLYQFNAGAIEQVYYQITRDVIIGNKHLCIVDSKGDVFVYFGGEKTLVAQSQQEIINTDHLLAVKTASVLRVFDQGVVHLLSPNATTSAVGDSIVLFQDFIGGFLNYYYQDEIHEIAMIVGNYSIMPGEVGSNVFVYRDNGGNHSVFWHGKFYNLFNSHIPTSFAAGQDVVAFNDPQHNSFSIFDNGYIIDLEGQFAKRYAAGDNFVYYQDAGDVHKVVREERVTELGIDLLNIVVTDSLVIYLEAGANKIWFNEEIYQIFNNQLTDYQTDGGIIAYKNAFGGVSAFVRGKEIDITRTPVNNFKLAGSTILLQFGPSSYSVWWNGKMYDF